MHKVLLIHPDPEVMETCRLALARHGFELQSASSGEEGLKKTYEWLPDLILAGSQTPDLKGYQICRFIKHDPATRHIALLLLLDSDEKIDRFWGIKAGADDLLTHGELTPKLLKKAQMLMDVYGQAQSKVRLHQATTHFDIRFRLSQIMDTALVETTLMSEFRGLSDLVHDSGLVNHMLFSLLASVIDYDAAALFYNDDNKTPRQVAFHFPEGKTQSSDAIDDMREHFFQTVQQRDGNTLFEMMESEVIGQVEEGVAPVAYQTRYLHEFYVESKLVGAWALYSEKNVDYSRIFPVTLIEEELRLLMRLRHLYSQAETLALTDRLTGLFNDRHFMTQLQQEFRSSRRYELDLSIAVISLDKLRQLNEKHGYAFGDEALKHIARVTEKSLRSVDVACRFGGSQLAVIFPKTQMEQARIALDRLQKSLVESPLTWDGQAIMLSISVGMSEMTPGIVDVYQLLRQAEEAVRKARQAGGNLIEIYSAA